VEDTDFVYKVRSRGLKVVLAPGATVQHRRRASILAICHHNYIRGYGRAFLWRRYPAQKQGAFFIPAAGLVQCLLLALLGVVFPWLWIVLGCELVLYVVLIAVSGVQGYLRLRRISALFVVPFLVTLHHFWYSLGILHAPLTGYRKILSTHNSTVADPFGVRVKKRNP
jgi:hypothetical protein